MQTVTLRLRLHRPTKAKIKHYRELVERTTAFANNLVAAGRTKGLTSRTAREYLAGDLPSAVINQALRDVAVVNAGGETLFFPGDQAAYVRRRYPPCAQASPRQTTPCTP